jgi:hypothetical protein
MLACRAAAGIQYAATNIEGAENDEDDDDASATTIVL